MNNKEILERAIHKAIDNGWRHKTPDDATRIVFADQHYDFNMYWDLDIWGYDDPNNYYHHIFNHDFAKALWGEYTIMHITGPLAWQHHLQQMVISEDPIKYLGEHM